MLVVAICQKCCLCCGGVHGLVEQDVTGRDLLCPAQLFCCLCGDCVVAIKHSGSAIPIVFENIGNVALIYASISRLLWPDYLMQQVAAIHNKMAVVWKGVLCRGK